MQRVLVILLLAAATAAPAHHTTPICDTEAGKMLCKPAPDGSKDEETESPDE
ncbi:MAG: hypothetical protein AAF922_12470 [Pseudomonadota bacterium]